MFIMYGAIAIKPLAELAGLQKADKFSVTQQTFFLYLQIQISCYSSFPDIPLDLTSLW